MSSNNEPSATENNDDSSHPVSMDADTDATSTTVPILSSERDEIEATNSSVPQAQPKSNEPISNINNKPQEGSSSVSRKKSRLQWDEENLTSNAAEMVRAGPRMKIDEPKTPYAAGGSSASENGSSASDSAHQSPPESPAFIPRERLVGFNALEQQEKGQAPAASSRNTNHNTTSSSGARHRSNSTGSNSGGGNVSDGASSVGSGGRSVHISDDNLGTSAGSSPRSKELFAMRRRAHYRNEARVFEWIRRSESDEDDDDDGEDDNNNDTSNENENENDNDNTNVASEVARRVTDRLEENNEDDSNMPNGQKENVDQDTNGHVKESHQQS